MPDPSSDGPPPSSERPSAPRPGETPIRHLRAVRPLSFPSSLPEADAVPEGKLHVILKTLLWQVLEMAYRGQHGIGCDQLLYWNARNPRRCCAPDAFIKLNAPRPPFWSWKTWEWGTPELAFEIELRTGWDGKWLSRGQRLQRYHEMGVREVILFDAEAPVGERLRAWDRVEDDLVERVVEDDTAPCTTLGLWCVVRHHDEDAPVMLRLARDAAGHALLPTPVEAERGSREAAQARIAELESELRKRGG